jgi:saccharopine dehydrogenase-like NADP-dependent oxidoreductase
MTKKVLLLGAGKSSSWLIDYLLRNTQEYDFNLCVADLSLEGANDKTKEHERAIPLQLDVNNHEKLTEAIAGAHLVISMLPAFMHIQVARICVALKRHLITASYVSPEIAALNEEATRAGVLLMNELGLDPGIDHLSAMKIIDELKEQGAVINSFKSYCGGLVAPESNDNPWGYKFSWNPRNVILAGQGTAKYLENGKYKYLPYHRLFAETETIAISGLGEFDGYANRDSLGYRVAYGLEQVETMIRGTLRQKDFCKAWNVFVQMGLTDDTLKITIPENYTWRELSVSFLPEADNLRDSVKKLVANDYSEGLFGMLEYTGVFGSEVLTSGEYTPAQLLQGLLERKWLLKTGDLDMIVMQHQFEYTLNGVQERLISDLVVKGQDATYTAMAKTVGLPIAMFTLILLKGRYKGLGVRIPVEKDIYLPLLNELKNEGIEFVEYKEPFKVQNSKSQAI